MPTDFLAVFPSLWKILETCLEIFQDYFDVHSFSLKVTLPLDAVEGEVLHKLRNSSFLISHGTAAECILGSFWLVCLSVLAHAHTFVSSPKLMHELRCELICSYVYSARMRFISLFRVNISVFVVSQIEIPAQRPGILNEGFRDFSQSLHMARYFLQVVMAVSFCVTLRYTACPKFVQSTSRIVTTTAEESEF